jgi:hypothetical protein
VEFPGVALAQLPRHPLQHLLFELLAAQVPTPPQRLASFLVDGLQREDNVVRHVVVQQELHGVGAAIWRATSTTP